MEKERAADLLYDHYKESFRIIRKTERARDFRFLFVVVLLALVVLQATFEVAFVTVVEQVKIFGFKIELARVPTAVILSSSWLFLFIFVVRYYQATMHIERQYSYLHTQEKRLSDLLPGELTIERESTGYMTSKGKLFRHWVWLFYTVAYPLVVLILVLWSIFLELNAAGVALPHKIFDSIMAILIGITVVCYGLGTWANR